MIADLGHIALRVPDVKACAVYAQDVLGLRAADIDDTAAHLTCDRVRTRVSYLAGPACALERVGLIAESIAAMEQLAGRLDGLGVPYDMRGLGDGIGEALLFETPDHHSLAVYADPAGNEPMPYATHGLRPTRFGHVTLTAPDVSLTEGFLVDVLGFRVSDRIGPGVGAWLRCSSEHHVLAVLRGPVAGLHHYAFDTEDLSGLGRLGDLLAMHGRAFIFGPGRHGPGNNLFTYHLDPAGICVEVCAEMEKVLHEEARETAVWPMLPSTENLWGPEAPEGFDDLCAPNARQLA
jgi:catechol 2,3-dioxygenase